MQPEKYIEMAGIEDRHWWFRGRRSLIRSQLEKLQLAPDTSILEMGCGTGGNLRMLQDYGEVSAVEMDGQSRDYASDKSGVSVQYGRLPEEVPFAPGSFELICLFDVLEHVEDDEAALARLNTIAQPGGRILLTVPATKWMYGKHDQQFDHYRRYSASELQRKLADAGWQVTTLSHYNTFLFPLAAIARFLDWLSLGETSVGMRVPNRLVNSMLYRIFVAETPLFLRSLLPYGLSLMALATAPGQAAGHDTLPDAANSG